MHGVLGLVPLGRAGGRLRPRAMVTISAHAEAATGAAIDRGGGGGGVVGVGGDALGCGGHLLMTRFGRAVHCASPSEHAVNRSLADLLASLVGW